MFSVVVSIEMQFCLGCSYILIADNQSAELIQRRWISSASATDSASLLIMPVPSQVERTTRRPQRRAASAGIDAKSLRRVVKREQEPIGPHFRMMRLSSGNHWEGHGRALLIDTI